MRDEMIRKAPLWARVWWVSERTINSMRVNRAVRKLVAPPRPHAVSAVAEDIVVSLTTHGDRLSSVHLVIRSILRGSVRPSRLVLWLDDPIRFADLPAELLELTNEGLEVRLTANFGPHTKYFPMVEDLGPQSTQALVTADDDIIYPTEWLERLRSAWYADPEMVHAYRCHRIRFQDEQSLLPYSTWTPAFPTEPSSQLFFTGVSGVLYPPRMVARLREAGTAFSTRAPRADDVWLNFVAFDAGFVARQVGLVPRHFPTVPGSQAVALANANIAGRENDQQIDATYSGDSIHRLYLASQRSNARRVAPRES